MNTKETLFAKRQKTKAIREAWRTKGLCIVCGKNQVGLNNDGTTSVRCPKCRKDMAVRKSRYRSAASVAQTTGTLGPDLELPNYLDTKEFAAYCTAVLESIVGRSSIGDQRRRLGDRYNPRWHQDAIESLVAVHAIAQSWCVKPLRWERVTWRSGGLTRDSVKENEWRRYKTQRSASVPADLLTGANG